MAQTDFIISKMKATELDENLETLAELLNANVQDGASVSFILPHSMADSTAFWRDKILPSLQAEKCILLVAKVNQRIAGCVMLDYDLPPNQPHRAEIAKLLVHPEFRRLGIARGLMQQIEVQAKGLDKQLLTLDTASQQAESLYSQLGYLRVGELPGFALNVQSSQLEATTIMYKTLK